MVHFDNSLRISCGTVRLTHEWQQILTSYWYDPEQHPMVVFAQPMYASGPSAVVRVRNARGGQFEIRAESTTGRLVTLHASWMALPQGVWDFGGGARLEVQTVDSVQLDRIASFVGQRLDYRQTYSRPIVVGQVQTANDRWSAFWAAGASSGAVPGPATLTVGHHVAEDRDRSHVAETLGVAVFEAGKYEINGVIFEAGQTPRSVVGWGSAIRQPPYEQELTNPAQIAITSSAGQRGIDGGWPVLYSNAFDAVGSSLPIAIDEDQVGGSERSHVRERVNWVTIDGRKDAARLLAQAGFGGDERRMAETYRIGFQHWLEQQRDQPQSVVTPYLDDLNHRSLGSNAGLTSEQQQAERQRHPENLSFIEAARPHATNFSTVWMRNILRRPDHLRQRVAFALSQIMVISANGNLVSSGASLGSYYDMLASHAFGNFEQLLNDVSLHPAMAHYLSSLGNDKASDDGTRQPDENYAREVMQLFTIGLWELNPDGTKRLDGANQPIPTYDNDDVTNLARIFTGLFYEGRTFGRGSLTQSQGVGPRPRLAMFDDHHDKGPKRLFAGKPWQLDLPGTDDGMTEIRAALNTLFLHPNTAPFIATRLIQFLVTSEPTPGYVERVAAKFNGNENVARGDMFATVRQVLRDISARGWHRNNPHYGKLQEPMIRTAQLATAFNAGHDLPEDQIYFWRWPGAIDLGQWPMFSPSVFNFFEPGHELKSTGRRAPEMQIVNPVTAATVPNNFARFIDEGLQLTRADVSPGLRCDFTSLAAVAADTEALIDRLDRLLCRGQMSEGTKSVIRANLPGETEIETRIGVSLWIAMVSPDAAVLR